MKSNTEIQEREEAFDLYLRLVAELSGDHMW